VPTWPRTHPSQLWRKLGRISHVMPGHCDVTSTTLRGNNAIECSCIIHIMCAGELGRYMTKTTYFTIQKNSHSSQWCHSGTV